MVPTAVLVAGTGAEVKVLGATTGAEVWITTTVLLTGYTVVVVEEYLAGQLVISAGQEVIVRISVV
jgi:hypothetical protein